jgi:hypothetical protein
MTRDEAIARAVEALREGDIVVESTEPFRVEANQRLLTSAKGLGWQIAFAIAPPRQDDDVCEDRADFIMVEVYEPGGEVEIIGAI